ncbi:MAG: ATP-binding cassette domain-containing protein [Bdellovibrionaceae bacterium]|nr:ATP-binding cassette domain-containing protein [Pseudobdellovibrionaceae bacterium]MCB9092892.1 ATP-binding cassette domain-containing protein [Halobacteriovoraceae bacterium]
MGKIKNLDTVEFKNVKFNFSGENETLFEHMNILFPNNKNLRLVGSTGSGKSTFLKILAGLELPSSGEYLINGISIGDLSFEEFTSYRLNIGFSFEYGGLLNNKSLKENILLPSQYHREFEVPGGKQRMHQLIERAGLKETANLRPSMVPGSHRKMTVVLRSLIMRPQLLLLDEPTIGLTAEGKEFLINLLKSERDEGYLKTLVFSSHDEMFCNEMTNTTIYIKDKKLIYSVDEAKRRVV